MNWKFEARGVVLAVDDVDTDQIIPARFLTTTSRDGLGKHLFADGRAFTAEDAEDAEVLIAGRNFGCGSSREHAVWALMDGGFRVVVARSFSDIFRANALKNGLLPVQLREEEIGALGETISVDLGAQTVNGFLFEIDAFAKKCLLEGVDEMGWLLAAESEIAAFEAKR
jgi:3-isopropylmalate/(R)-2-methylmalate dehydratase small subunit